MANAITSVASNASLGYEVIWKPLIENPKINSLPFTIHLGKIGRDLYFDSEFTGEPTVKADCGWTFQTGNSITKKNLNPFELRMRRAMPTPRYNRGVRELSFPPRCFRPTQTMAAAPKSSR